MYNYKSFLLHEDERVLEGPSRQQMEISNKLGVVQTVNENNCSFPFLYKGRLRYGCVEDGYQRPWCATEVKTNKEVFKSEHCPPIWRESLCSRYEVKERSKKDSKDSSEISQSFDINEDEAEESLESICRHERFSRQAISPSREPGTVARKKTKSTNKAYSRVTATMRRKRSFKKKKKHQTSIEHQE